MSTQSEKAEISRKNAQLSTGPRNATSTRYNAVKHGLLAEGVTEMDNPETFPVFYAKLEAEFKPVGEMETFLVRRVALGMLRLKRATALEAEYVTWKLNPPLTETTGGLVNKTYEEWNGTTVVVDPGLPPRLSSDVVDALTCKFQRYETAIENKLLRAMHELERLQRLRQGDNVPAPAALDVAASVDTPPLASFGNPSSAEAPAS